VRGDGVQERELVVVERAVGVDAEHEHARRGAQAQRQHHGRVRGERPERVDGRETGGEAVPEPADDDRLPGAQRLRQRRPRPVRRRERRQPVREAVGGRHLQARHTIAVRPRAQDGGERYVLRVARERVERGDGDLVDRVTRGRDAHGGQVAQRAQRLAPAVLDHAGGGLGGGREDGEDLAVLAAHGGVRERPVGLLLVVPATQDHRLVVDADGRPARQHPGERGTDRLPRVGEPGGARPAERRGVGAPDERGERVVVERDEVGPDPQHHRLRGLQHDPRGRAERPGPRRERPERARRPVVLADQRAELATCGEEGERAGSGHPESLGPDGVASPDERAARRVRSRGNPVSGSRSPGHTARTREPRTRGRPGHRTSRVRPGRCGCSPRSRTRPGHRTHPLPCVVPAPQSSGSAKSGWTVDDRPNRRG
jgi:hypothetical protein